MTDEEVNITVARKLGWEYKPKDMSNFYGYSDWISPWHVRENLPDYCHSIEAAWEVVEYCLKLGPIDLDGSDGVFRFFVFNDKGPDYCAEADTAPMAICLAFLKLP